ncbi:MAG: DUF2946 family protein [Rhizobiales bacterium]|nr:DUF2946 family protein [Hyphomicrobiales bacterium]
MDDPPARCALRERTIARRLLVCALALLFALRALIPLGYMPRAEAAFELRLVICHGAPEAAQADYDGRSDKTDGVFSLCPYAALAHHPFVHAPAADVHILRTATAGRRARPARRSRLPSPRRRRPGARAPPSAL